MRISLRSVAPLLPALALLVALGWQLPADPERGVTFSNSPFSDEAWNVMAARNWALLGDWSAGNWPLHIVQLPFTLLQAAGFAVMGVGIVQARIVALLLTALTVAGVGVLVARRLGWSAGFLAAAALGGSSLVLYYGRLVYLENLVMAGLVGGTAALVWPSTGRGRWTAVLAGALLAVAIGTKASALFTAAGIPIGAWLAVRDRAWAGRALVVAGAVALAGVGWVVLVALPNPQQVEWVLEIWTPQQPPGDVGEALQRIVRFFEDDATFLMALPVAIGGVAGTVAAFARWRDLDPGQRALLGAALGWLALGLAVLLVASYRPNRYALPILPPLAVLSGFLVPLGEALLLQLRARHLAVPLLLAAALLVTAPGGVMWARWAYGSTARLPELQQQFVELMDDRPVSGGIAPAFAMRVPVPIFVSWPSSDLNTHDLYAEEGVRWYVDPAAMAPRWAAQHPDAWEAREQLLCAPWGAVTYCLNRVP